MGSGWKIHAMCQRNGTTWCPASCRGWKMSEFPLKMAYFQGPTVYLPEGNKSSCLEYTLWLFYIAMV